MVQSVMEDGVRNESGPVDKDDAEKRTKMP